MRRDYLAKTLRPGCVYSLSLPSLTDVAPSSLPSDHEGDIIFEVPSVSWDKKKYIQSSSAQKWREMLAPTCVQQLEAKGDVPWGWEEAARGCVSVQRVGSPDVLDLLMLATWGHWNAHVREWRERADGALELVGLSHELWGERLAWKFDPPAVLFLQGLQQRGWSAGHVSGPHDCEALATDPTAEKVFAMPADPTKGREYFACLILAGGGVLSKRGLRWLPVGQPASYYMAVVRSPQPDAVPIPNRKARVARTTGAKRAKVAESTAVADKRGDAEGDNSSDADDFAATWVECVGGDQGSHSGEDVSVPAVAAPASPEGRGAGAAASSSSGPAPAPTCAPIARKCVEVFADCSIWQDAIPRPDGYHPVYVSCPLARCDHGGSMWPCIKTRGTGERQCRKFGPKEPIVCFAGVADGSP